VQWCSSVIDAVLCATVQTDCSDLTKLMCALSTRISNQVDETSMHYELIGNCVFAARQQYCHFGIVQVGATRHTSWLEFLCSIEGSIAASGKSGINTGHLSRLASDYMFFAQFRNILKQKGVTSSLPTRPNVHGHFFRDRYKNSFPTKEKSVPIIAAEVHDSITTDWQNLVQSMQYSSPMKVDSIKVKYMRNYFEQIQKKQQQQQYLGSLQQPLSSLRQQQQQQIPQPQQQPIIVVHQCQKHDSEVTIGSSQDIINIAEVAEEITITEEIEEEVIEEREIELQDDYEEHVDNEQKKQPIRKIDEPNGEECYGYSIEEQQHNPMVATVIEDDIISHSTEYVDGDEKIVVSPTKYKQKKRPYSRRQSSEYPNKKCKLSSLSSSPSKSKRKRPSTMGVSPNKKEAEEKPQGKVEYYEDRGECQDDTSDVNDNDDENKENEEYQQVNELEHRSNWSRSISFSDSDDEDFSDSDSDGDGDGIDDDNVCVHEENEQYQQLLDELEWRINWSISVYDDGVSDHDTDDEKMHIDRTVFCWNTLFAKCNEAKKQQLKSNPLLLHTEVHELLEKYDKTQKQVVQTIDELRSVQKQLNQLKLQIEYDHHHQQKKEEEPLGWWWQEKEENLAISSLPPLSNSKVAKTVFFDDYTKLSNREMDRLIRNPTLLLRCLTPAHPIQKEFRMAAEELNGDRTLVFQRFCDEDLCLELQSLFMRTLPPSPPPAETSKSKIRISSS